MPKPLLLKDSYTLDAFALVGREFLTNRDAKRAKAQAEALENAIWKPDFNKGQMLSSMLLLEKLNLLQLLTSGERLRGSDEAMQEFKARAVENRYLIKNCLNVTVSEKLTPVAFPLRVAAGIAQKLLSKIDLRLSYVGRLGSRGNRESVYQFVAPDDGRSGIFSGWLNRELVSVSNNVELKTQVADTTSQLMPHNQDSVSVTNNIELQTLPCDTTLQSTPQTEDTAVQGWKGLKLRIRQGLDCAGQFYQELVAKVGEAIGIADGEPVWNGYLGQWQVWVNFADSCRSVGCDWLVAV